MTTPDDARWRRPGGEDPPTRSSAGGTPPPAGTEYTGPPQSAPPPPGWRPEFVVQPPPPRALPGQDHAGLDAQEASARRVTYGVGLVAAGILLLALCALCARAVF